MDDLRCAVNHVLSCHGFRFLLIFFRSLLGYLKDCNVAAHSVDSDIFYVVINLSAGSKSYIFTFISYSSVKLWCVNYNLSLYASISCIMTYRWRSVTTVTGPGITNNLITLNHKPRRLNFVLPCLVV